MQKIISGGQTGVDRAALDAALNNFFPCGGYCPAGRLAEDGPIDQQYPLIELASPKYPDRTLKNIEESNGTLIIYYHELNGGTALTCKLSEDCLKPYCLIDSRSVSIDLAVMECLEFIHRFNIKTLNVAGPRASTSPQIYSYAFQVIDLLLCEID